MGVICMGQGKHQICDLKQQCRERGTTPFFFHRFREEETSYYACTDFFASGSVSPRSDAHRPPTPQKGAHAR